MIRRRLPVRAWVLVCSVAARASYAQTDPREAEARTHFDQGVALMNDHRYADAAVEFDLVRSLRPTPAVYYNLGIAQRSIGRNLEAIASFRACLDARGASVTPAHRREIEGYLAELMGRLGHLALAIEPADARVRVDERAIAQGTRTVDVDPGHHVVVAQADGYALATREFDIVGGSRVEMALSLVREPVAVPAPTPAPALRPIPVTTIRVDADASDAIVWVDGQPTSSLPGARIAVRPGHHRVEVRAAGRIAFGQDLDLDAGGEARVHAHLAVRHDVVASPWLWTAVGVAVVGGVVATVIAVAADAPRAPYVGSWGATTSLAPPRGAGAP